MPEEVIALKATGITKRFGAVRALRGVDLELRAGEVTALMGENGAGKSTLLKILGGDFRPDEGELLIDGAPVRFSDPADARAAGLRVIAQEPEIIPHVSVAENIYVGNLGTVRYKRCRLLRTCDDALRTWGFDRAIRADMLGSALSPAQRQIVEIMRAVIAAPRILCFDEPTSSLGDEEVGLLFSLIRRLRDGGTAIGYVSHRMGEIFRLADRITVLRDGGFVGTKRADETDNSELVRMMVGRDLTQFFQRGVAEPGEVALELQGVSNQFVHDIDLTVRAGEVVGIAGLVGAGRSELMKTIAGDYPAREGQIRIADAPRRIRQPSDSIRAGIGFAPEERKDEALLLQRSVRDNTSLVVLKTLSRFTFVDGRAERALADEFIDQLNIRTPSSDQLVGNLSGGNQQKVVLARWLAAHPRILLLDEPTRGIDVGAKAEIYAIIDRLAHEGVAVIMVSSELPEILGVSDRVYVMAGGRITGELTREEATEEAILSLAMIEENAA